MSEAQVALTDPPPDGFRYEIINYRDVNTGQMIWIVGAVEVSNVDSIVSVIGVEGAAGGTTIIALILREIIAFFRQRKKE